MVLIAHQRTRLGCGARFQLPKPFQTLNLVDNLRVPLIYTVNARSEDTCCPLAEVETRPVTSLAAPVGARRQARDPCCRAT